MAVEIYHHCILCNLTSVYPHMPDSLLGYYVRRDEYFSGYACLQYIFIFNPRSAY